MADGSAYVGLHVLAAVIDETGTSPRIKSTRVKSIQGHRRLRNVAIRELGNHARQVRGVSGAQQFEVGCGAEVILVQIRVSRRECRGRADDVVSTSSSGRIASWNRSGVS